nr:WYL domain-containing protein [uncultured Campylobacter sp.]
MSSDSNNKTLTIFKILKKLVEKQEIYPSDAQLLDELKIKERTLRRYIEDIKDLFPETFVTENKLIGQGKRSTGVLRVSDKSKDVITILEYLLKNSNDIGWLITLLNENDPNLLSEFEKEISRQVKEDSKVFLFKTNPLEALQDEPSKRYLGELRSAVMRREYRDIRYKYIGEVENLMDSKCLKIVFTDGNWYLAIEDNEENFRLLRVAFIVSLSKSSKNYQSKILDKYKTHFNKIQNAMSLPSEPFQRAVLKASPKVSIYFRKGMKSFFPSQKLNETMSDGSVIFSIDFTQDMEILPFIKRWLPDIEILEPKSLRDKFKDELKAALDLLNK